MPLSEESLNDEFLAMCRDWEQEYCYEVESFQGADMSNRAWRVYAKDGRRVPVYGLNINLSPRSLRDVAAAGGEERVSYWGGDSLGYTVVTPSLLLEEAEILPSDAKPDREPFVPKP